MTNLRKSIRLLANCKAAEFGVHRKLLPSGRSFLVSERMEENST